jgi:hypothetical protein
MLRRFLKGFLQNNQIFVGVSIGLLAIHLGLVESRLDKSIKSLKTTVSEAKDDIGL